MKTVKFLLLTTMGMSAMSVWAHGDHTIIELSHLVEHSVFSVLIGISLLIALKLLITRVRQDNSQEP
ncbi:MAG: hypothetical protein AAF541_05090 [Pseudomonadota bacterium]